MKVLYIINKLTISGAENLLLYTIKSIREMHPEIEIVLVGCRKGNKAFVDEFRPYVNNVIELNFKENINAFFCFSEIRKLMKIIKNEKPTIVHSMLFFSIIISRVCRIFLKFPVLINSFYDTSEFSKSRNFAFKVTDFLSTAATNDNKMGADNYVNKGIVPKNKMHFIPNGLILSDTITVNESEVETIRNTIKKKDNDFVWINIARLNAEKNHKNLINAVEFIINTGIKNFKILLVGEGYLRQEIEKLIIQKGLGEYFILFGFRKDIENFFKVSDAFILASDVEGTPISLIQAYQAGLPCVGTDVGEISKIIINNISGYCVPPKNHLLLAEAMLNIMNAPKQEILRMGASGKTFVNDNFDIRNTVNSLIKLYTKVS